MGIVRWLCLGQPLLALLLLASCISPVVAPTASQATAVTETPVEDSVDTIAPKVESLLAQMTLAEKIGQMTQVEKGSIKPGDITTYFIGSILSGGGGAPVPNKPAAWVKMVNGFQEEALAARLAIPLIYGIDAVHGHNNLYGATIFPHNIGLGATGDADLVRRIGQATALELAATGIPWDFAPVIAVPQDIRWGAPMRATAKIPRW